MGVLILQGLSTVRGHLEARTNPLSPQALGLGLGGGVPWGLSALARRLSWGAALGGDDCWWELLVPRRWRQGFTDWLSLSLLRSSPLRPQTLLQVSGHPLGVGWGDRWVGASVCAPFQH